MVYFKLVYETYIALLELHKTETAERNQYSPFCVVCV